MRFTGFLLRFVITGTFSEVTGTKMGVMPPFLAMHWQVGIGVEGGHPLPLGGPWKILKFQDQMGAF